MRYTGTSQKIMVGDLVVVEGDVSGLVVCDFDTWTCLPGYEDWLTKDQLADDSYMESGVLIKTSDLGMLYYCQEDESILFVK